MTVDPMRMAEHADALAREWEGLDFTLETLAVFEQALKTAKPQDERSLEQWVAYLGETMVRTSNGGLRWSNIGTLDGGGSTWFVRDKVVKYLTHSKQDSPAAFASVAVTLAKPAPADEEERPINQKGRKAVEGFFSAPSIESLRALAGARSHLYHNQLVRLLREQEAAPEHFYPWFEVKPEGKGREQFDVAHAAAEWVRFLLHQGLAEFTHEESVLTAMLSSKDKRIRSCAAYVLGSWHVQAGDCSTAVSLFETSDPTIRMGVLKGTRMAIYDKVNWTPSQPEITLPPVANYAPILLGAFRGNNAERTLALKATQTLSGKLKIDITPLLDALLEVLSDGKPAQIETALDCLGNQVYSVKHERAIYDPRLGVAIPAIVHHTKPIAGKIKVTKVQKASHYTLAAYRTIAQHLDTHQANAVHKALAYEPL